MIESVWYGCYDESLKGIITPESFRHPAKMAKILCERIFQHGEELGYWQPGDDIGEPFAGVFTVGITGAYRGYHVIGVELEPHFFELALANIEKNRKKLAMLGKPLPVIVQGDSRRFRFLVNGVITSPPYARSVHDGNGIDRDKLTGNTAGEFSQAFAEGYGDTDGQIGALGGNDFEQVAGVVTSPPYADNNKHDHTHEERDARRLGENFKGRGKGSFRGSENYGETDGQIGNLGEGELSGVVTSPPFGPAQQGGGIAVNGYHNEAQRKGVFDLVGDRSYMPSNHGESDGQIGNLPITDLDGVISSPPWEKSLARDVVDADARREYARAHGISNAEHITPVEMERIGARDQEYGHTDGQIGNKEKETYWQAMAQVYQQVYLALRPGGVAAIVVKDYIRDKRRVPLCDQTATLLERLGFTIVERTRAMLVKEQSQASLFQSEDTGTTTTNLVGTTTTQAGADLGEVAVTERVERMSFFRRLHGKKYPHLKIEWEEVIWAQKDSGEKGGEISGAVTSPPYAEGLGHGGEPQDIGSGGQVSLNAIISGYGQTPGQIGQLKEGELP